MFPSQKVSESFDGASDIFCVHKNIKSLGGIFIKTLRIPELILQREYHKILRVLRCLLFACYQSFVQIFDHFSEYEGQIFGCYFLRSAVLFN